MNSNVLFWLAAFGFLCVAISNSHYALAQQDDDDFDDDGVVADVSFKILYSTYSTISFVFKVWFFLGGWTSSQRSDGLHQPRSNSK